MLQIIEHRHLSSHLLASNSQRCCVNMVFRPHREERQITKFTNEMIEAVIQGFESQKKHIDSQIAELRAMLLMSTKPSTSDSQRVSRKKRGMSAAGRRAIAEAQRKRWAAVKGESAAPKAAKTKRKLSGAGRAAIVAALKKRWAAKKAAANKKAA